MRRTGGEPAVAAVLPERQAARRVADILRRYFDRDGRLQGDPAEAVPALVAGSRAAPARGAHQQGGRAVGRPTGRAAPPARSSAASSRRSCAPERARSPPQAAALPVPDRRHAASRVHRTGAARGRDGARQDGASGRRPARCSASCAASPACSSCARCRSRPSGRSRSTKFTDLPFRFVHGHEARPARLLRGSRVLHHRQLRAGDARCRGRQPAAAARCRDSGRSAADQELEHPDGAQRSSGSKAATRSCSPARRSRTASTRSTRSSTSSTRRCSARCSASTATFYELDDRGRPVGYRNLDELQRRIRPLLLRRRKDQIESQLPERVDNNYFVPMSAAQVELYGEYEDRVARLLASGEKARP